MSGPFFADMAHTAASNEWCDFDCLPDLDSFYLDSEPASALSFSPMESNVDTDISLDFDPALCLQSSTPTDFAGCDPFLEEPFHSAFSDLGATCDAGLQLNEGLPAGNVFVSGPPLDQTFDFTLQDVSAQAYPPSSIRQLVEATAAADTRRLSWKEKLREASIAIHLKRLMDASAAEIDLSSNSNTTFSSPTWSDFVQDADSPQSTSFTTKTASISTTSRQSSNPSPSPSAAAPEPVAGGVEIVLDLNMNAATNLPKKQKPRSQAQKESYIKIRKHGACEKHRKQHKRCNCLDKNLAQVGTSATNTHAPTLRPPASLHYSGVAKASVLTRVRPDANPLDCAVPQAAPSIRVVRPRSTTTSPEALLVNRTPSAPLQHSPRAQSRLLAEARASGELRRPTKDCSAILRDSPGRASSYGTAAASAASSLARSFLSTTATRTHCHAVSRAAVPGSAGIRSDALPGGRALHEQCGAPHAWSSPGFISTRVAARDATRNSERSVPIDQRVTIFGSTSSDDTLYRHLGPLTKQTRTSVLAGGAGAAMQSMVLACIASWRTSISVWSWTTSILRKVATASCRSFVLARKGLRIAML